MKTIHATREAWLSAAISIFRSWFEVEGHKLPKVIRVSVGFPSVRALSAKNRAIGQCWTSEAAKDGSTHVFISPVIDDAMRVGDVLIHELCHALLPKEVGHKGAFARIAKKMGLTGKMTSTEAGPELVKRLNGAMKSLGSYPHIQLDPAKSPVKKQATRLLKAECGECGYIIRVTQKWIDDAGLPTCPCGEKFEEA
jgi:hypothetical protein